MSIRENTYKADIAQKAKLGNLSSDRFAECKIHFVFSKPEQLKLSSA
jgi:hypothetical protein